MLSKILTLSQTSPVFTCLQKSFENTVGKGEIALNEQIPLFPIVFSIGSENFLPAIFIKLKMPSADSLSLEESKICCLGKG